MKKITIFIRKNYISIICSMLIIFMCFLNGMGAKYVADFQPLNGTFQNYNPVRRWLDGQVPTRDFSTYLGYGHLIMGGIVTWIAGGSYADSLFAFAFLTLLLVSVISYVLGQSILQSSNAAQICTLLFLVCLVSNFVAFTPGSILQSIFGEAFVYALTPGNSARFIRGAAPALYVCAAGSGLKWVKHSKYYKRSKTSTQEMIDLIVVSVVGGLFFTYSNDYGISTWLCAGIVCAFAGLSKKRKFIAVIKTITCYILTSLISIVVFVMLITHGHVGKWIRATFGTGGFQSWYYLAGHSYYIYDADFSFLMMVQAILVVYYGICIFRCKAENNACRRYGIPVLLNMTAFCAANEYRMLSGNYLRETAYAILIFTIGYEVVLSFRKAVGQKCAAMLIRKCAVFAVIMGGGWCFSYGMQRGIASLNTDRGTYVEEMGGYMTNLAEDLIDAKDFLMDKKVFATYSSALETVTDQYQPSGYDYIIHVLGENARKEYLESFRKENFNYVATIRADFTDWENWAKNANWFFYRELYHNYHPVYCNSYEMFWEKNQNKGDGICIEGSEATVELQPLNDYQSKITVKCRNSIDGVADIKLTYHSEKAHISQRENLMWFRCVNVRDTKQHQIYETDRNTFNLPKEGSTDIPITIVDGEGEIVISSQPDKFTKLYIDGVSCSQIYTVTFSYIDLVEQAKQISDKECVIKINNNNWHQKIVEKGTQVILNGESWDIIEVDEDESFIYLSVNGDANKFNANLGNENVVRID